MPAETSRKLIGKIEITGNLHCITGLHIGASREKLEIGALDAPVVRDPLTLEPYIPGSSLKGKLRALLEKANPDLLPEREGGTDQNSVKRHECNDSSQAVTCPVCRLFGSTGSDSGKTGEDHRNFPARLKVRDLKLKNKEKLAQINTGLLFTEWKFENSIDRVTSAANPRNLERVPKGAEFGCDLVYDVEDTNTVNQDIENLMLAIRLLHDDALGGHGSRGYGQVKLIFNCIIAKKIDYYRGDEAEIRTINIPAEADITEENIRELVAFIEEKNSNRKD